ncbi:MAG TPA: hypothetical protein VFB62_22370 [Polyangiaceae bacterium]|nr:hypothetical protein [Polyangiaceae bacterium]
MNRLSAYLMTFVLLASACDKKETEETADEPKKTPTEATSDEKPAAPQVDQGNADDLKKQIETTMNAVSTRDMDAVQNAILGMAMTPDNAKAWFEKTFGPELGKKLAADWEQEVFANLPKLVRPFKEAGAEGRTEVQVMKIASATDSNATGLQKSAIEAMKAPVSLYTVKLVKPGATSGSSMWSFAYIDGSYVFLGEMKGVKS